MNDQSDLPVLIYQIDRPNYKTEFKVELLRLMNLFYTGPDSCTCQKQTVPISFGKSNYFPKTIVDACVKNLVLKCQTNITLVYKKVYFCELKLLSELEVQSAFISLIEGFVEAIEYEVNNPF